MTDFSRGFLSRSLLPLSSLIRSLRLLSSTNSTRRLFIISSHPNFICTPTMISPGHLTGKQAAASVIPRRKLSRVQLPLTSSLKRNRQLCPSRKNSQRRNNPPCHIPHKKIPDLYHFYDFSPLSLGKSVWYNTGNSYKTQTTHVLPPGM